jgi:hypothetical protein
MSSCTRRVIGVLVAVSLICLARELEEAGLKACIEVWRPQEAALFVGAEALPVETQGLALTWHPGWESRKPGDWRALSGGFLALAAAERVLGWTCRWERQRRAWEQGTLEAQRGMGSLRSGPRLSLGAVGQYSP